MKKLDLNNWKRKEHFEFFMQYDEPFYGIVSEIDCTDAYRYAKENRLSFFALYLHRSLIAVNGVEEFRYRIHDGKVYVYDVVHAGSTIGRADGTFAFSFVEYTEDFNVFQASLQKEIEAVQKSTGLRKESDSHGDNIIHYSSLPWITFTGVTHPMNHKIEDSCPKITFGKVFERADRMIMPVGVYAHHALIDGFHIARHLELFQEIMNTGK